MEDNEVTTPYYLVEETFEGDFGRHYNEEVFKNDNLLVSRQEALDYAISQLKKFKTSEGNEEESYPWNWFLDFNEVEFYESYVYLVTDEVTLPIGCADENLEDKPATLEQLEALKQEMDILLINGI
ncbi:MAG: hypothetical protein U0T74_15045 [Chitinophagales bacterium]